MLDRTRLIAEKRLGTDPVDPLTSFEEGDLLHWSSGGWVKSGDGTASVLRGIAGVVKKSTLTGAVINEQVILPGTTAVPLNHANVSNDRVTDITGGTVYVNGTDYTLNATNGTIARIPTGGIGDGDTVLVSYLYQRTAEEVEEEVGKNIRNDLDETFGSGNVVVLTGDCEIHTDRFDTSKAYAINAVLYDNGDGLLTSDGTGGKVAVGRVKKSPTANDAFLGAVLSL